jgi:hypothetical protein
MEISCMCIPLNRIYRSCRIQHIADKSVTNAQMDKIVHNARENSYRYLSEGNIVCWLTRACLVQVETSERELPNPPGCTIRR